MRLALALSIVLTISGLTTVALAAGFSARQLAALPWFEIGLIAFPLLVIAFARVPGDS
ncbi:MAG: hypothetical protein AAF830_05780 [Pseudomonadota bacterium]